MSHSHLSHGHPQQDRVKVVHLSSVHSAEDARIFSKECISLAKAGYEVSLVVPDNHLQAAGGQPARRQDVDILAVKRNQGLPKRLFRTTWSVLFAALKLRGDVYHFHDPELIPIGLLLRLLGKRVVYDVHEDLPRDLMTRRWIPRALRQPVASAVALTEWTAGRAMSGVVAATPIIARRFPKEKTALVQNFAILQELGDVGGPPLAERRGVALVGGITVDRCALDMVEAIGRVGRFPDAKLLMAGNMESTALRDRMEALPGWSRVDYRGHLDRPGVRQLLSESRVGLVLYYPTRNYAEAQPVKLFEYMATGIPIIVTDLPYLRSVVDEHRCGLVVPPRDPAAIASAIEWMFDHPEEAAEMGRRGQEAVRSLYNWGHEERELIRLYDRIAPRRSRDRTPLPGLAREKTEARS
ncbi:glycosyltransferase family 4 protein [Azospirillum soli]|uniref:glycosyltransferase family 4 protein n=1 Tax=Azospirillum soli TaxID=1304799 RepID=UPI001AE2D4E6|nr:glycosyltransferase family 4 protein [Azospirillum soli]MBP2312734.1 glycosyltransferase involved in cell wall biosynthesis [Azospirillum soli]